MQRYNNHTDHFLYLLTLLVYLACLAYCGTELMSLKCVNTANTIRNIYIINSRLVTFTNYNKTNNMAKRPKVIGRYLSPRVEHLLMAYLVNVRPSRLALRCLQEPTAADIPASPYLFYCDSKPYTTDNLT